jgi:hypothetical protein
MPHCCFSLGLLSMATGYVERCKIRRLSSRVSSETMTPPNKALQLTPNSAVQSRRGTVLAAGASAPALAVSAVGRS